MAEELSRQLEDILSTYCRESISDDASTLPNGQSHSPELNGLTREDDKPEELMEQTTGVEKEQKKTQEKKKVKGLGKESFTFFVYRDKKNNIRIIAYFKQLSLLNQLITSLIEFSSRLSDPVLSVFFVYAGKEITLLMQTLNTLSTPEEKLAGLCKKYAELVSVSHKWDSILS